MEMEFNPQNLESYLRKYYQHYYPYELIIKWLSCPKVEHQLSHREFAFIMKDDFHLRFLSFNGAQEFKENLLKFVPHKIDIGAVYNRSPRDRKKIGDFFPQGRELIFDIDLTDYDSIRTCCKETNVCQKCWRWIKIAVKVLEKLLRDHFGFKQLLWVFSGRRGIHCWVADRKAFTLNNRAREAVAKYLTFDKKSSVINKSRVHPMAEHAYREIMDSAEFDKLVQEQGWLDAREQWQAVLKLCPDADTRDKLDKEFENCPSSQLRWDLLKMRYDAVEREKLKQSGRPQPQGPSEADKNFLRFFVLEYAYPRLDEKVSTSLNHLLKAPFTVHPKTGNISVPLSAAAIANLQLNKLPRVDKLCTMEIGDKNEEKENTANNSQARLHESLAPYVATFEEFIKAIQL